MYSLFIRNRYKYIPYLFNTFIDRKHCQLLCKKVVRKKDGLLICFSVTNKCHLWCE